MPHEEDEVAFKLRSDSKGASPEVEVEGGGESGGSALGEAAAGAKARSQAGG